MYIDVPLRITMGLMHPSDGSIPGPEKREAKMWSTKGKLYILGVRAFVAEDIDLTVSIFHPRTKEPLRLGVSPYPLKDVRVALLNPDFPRGVPYTDVPYIPVMDLHDPDDMEPMYCSEELPLVIEITGPHVLHLAVFGCDYYVAGSGSPFPDSGDPPFKEFRGPCGVKPRAL